MEDITHVPGEGLDILLEKYRRLQVSVGGADYWFLPNQQLLISKLAPFLPRMEFDKVNNTVRASMFDNGVELMSTSRPVKGDPPQLPMDELEHLTQAVEDLKAEALNTETDENIRALINAFVLPDPRVSPELYRIVGPKKAPRLAILWGLEKTSPLATSVKLNEMDVKSLFVKVERPEPGIPYKTLGISAAVIIALLLINRCTEDSQPTDEPAKVLSSGILLPANSVIGTASSGGSTKDVYLKNDPAAAAGSTIVVVDGRGGQSPYVPYTSEGPVTGPVSDPDGNIIAKVVVDANGNITEITRVAPAGKRIRLKTKDGKDLVLVQVDPGKVPAGVPTYTDDKNRTYVGVIPGGDAGNPSKERGYAGKQQVFTVTTDNNGQIESATSTATPTDKKTGKESGTLGGTGTHPPIPPAQPKPVLIPASTPVGTATNSGGKHEQVFIKRIPGTANAPTGPTKITGTDGKPTDFTPCTSEGPVTGQITDPEGNIITAITVDKDGNITEITRVAPAGKRIRIKTKDGKDLELVQVDPEKVPAGVPTYTDDKKLTYVGVIPGGNAENPSKEAGYVGGHQVNSITTNEKGEIASVSSTAAGGVETIPGGGTQPPSGGVQTIPGGGAQPPSDGVETIPGGGTQPPSGGVQTIPGGGTQPPSGGVETIPGGGAQPPSGGVETIPGGGTQPPSGGVQTIPGGGTQPPSAGVETIPGGGTQPPSGGVQTIPGGGTQPPSGGVQTIPGGGTQPPSGGVQTIPGGGTQPPSGGVETIPGGGTQPPSGGVQTIPGGGAQPPSGGVQTIPGGGTQPPSGGVQTIPGGGTQPISGSGTETASKPEDNFTIAYTKDNRPVYIGEKGSKPGSATAKIEYENGTPAPYQLYTKGDIPVEGDVYDKYKEVIVKIVVNQQGDILYISSRVDTSKGLPIKTTDGQPVTLKRNDDGSLTAETPDGKKVDGPLMCGDNEVKVDTNADGSLNVTALLQRTAAAVQSAPFSVSTTLISKDDKVVGAEMTVKPLNKGDKLVESHVIYTDTKNGKHEFKADGNGVITITLPESDSDLDSWMVELHTSVESHGQVFNSSSDKTISKPTK